MSEDLYKIGAVAKQTGISPECLRAWERRYGLQPAERAGQTRFYSTQQVNRLAVIKSLLDLGHPISQVIDLDAAELKRRLHQPQLRASSGLGHIGVVGGQLIHAYRTAEHAQVEPRYEWYALADLADREAPPPLDGLVVYLPSLEAQLVENIEKIYPSAGLVVAYRYTTRTDREECEAAGYTLLRWPANWPAVEEALVDASQSRRSVAAGRVYSDQELCHIRLMASRAACECTSDLADLVGQLNDFAAHSERCAGDEDHAATAADVHAARTQLEQSLRTLVEKHGLLEAVN